MTWCLPLAGWLSSRGFPPPWKTTNRSMIMDRTYGSPRFMLGFASLFLLSSSVCSQHIKLSFGISCSGVLSFCGTYKLLYFVWSPRHTRIYIYKYTYYFEILSDMFSDILFYLAFKFWHSISGKVAIVCLCPGFCRILCWNLENLSRFNWF
jgi:hypothetical protein